MRISDWSSDVCSSDLQLLQRVDGPRHRSGAGEGAVIATLIFARAAMLLDAGKVMILAQQDEGEALVVAQQDIIGRPEPLDELRLQQQSLRLERKSTRLNSSH